MDLHSKRKPTSIILSFFLLCSGTTVTADIYYHKDWFLSSQIVNKPFVATTENSEFGEMTMSVSCSDYLCGLLIEAPCDTKKGKNYVIMTTSVNPKIGRSLEGYCHGDNYIVILPIETATATTAGTNTKLKSVVAEMKSGSSVSVYASGRFGEFSTMGFTSAMARLQSLSHDERLERIQKTVLAMSPPNSVDSVDTVVMMTMLLNAHFYDVFYDIPRSTILKEASTVKFNTANAAD